MVLSNEQARVVVIERAGRRTFSEMQVLKDGHLELAMLVEAKRLREVPWL
jgi:hypothetical protein